MTVPRLISVLLAEDHVVVRQGLSALLAEDGRFVVVGQARNGREAVDLAATLKPDVILMDIAMPILNGLEATRQVLAHDPKASVLILSAHSDDEYVKRFVHVGVKGFLEKQTSAEVLARAIIEVAAGRSFVSPSIERRQQSDSLHPRDRDGIAKPNPARLTSRESEVLQLVAEGAANKQVAAVLGISIKTVEKHRQHLMDKLNIHDTAGLTRYAMVTGVIEGGVRLTIL